MKTLSITLSENSYNIYIGSEILSGINSYLEKYDSILILTNTTVGKLYRESLLNQIAEHLKDSKKIEFFEIPDGEEHKNFETLNSIYDFMLNSGFLRNSLILTLGGGVVCDIGGFVAATFMRGIDFIQIPTSLLAQVDASIGGKVAINHETFKNSIGAFYQPKAVFIDTKFLKTLPEAEFASGMGEVIKHALIKSAPSLFGFIEENVDKIKALDSEIISDMIEKSCLVKKSIVERDEKETGERAFLNLGHTYSHALEATYHFKNISHGEGVAKGLIFELHLAKLTASEPSAHYDSLILKLSELFRKFNMDSEPVHLRAETLLLNMRKDKKNSRGNISFIIFEDFGKLKNISIPEEKILKVNDFFKKLSVKAVIDIGTNSTRLLISEAAFSEETKLWNIHKNLLELVTITHLGKGVNSSRKLSDESMKITLDCMDSYDKLAKAYGAISIKGFATSAVRDAQNRDFFIDAAASMGIDVTCISGELEAKLSLVGNSSIFPESKIGIIDIGGGSTEFSLGSGKDIDFLRSYNVGAVRVTEMFFKDDDYREKNWTAATQWIDNQLSELKNFADVNFNLLGVAGTVTTQATVLEKMVEYDRNRIHLYKVSLENVERNLKLFLSMPLEERRQLQGLEPKRADVIIAGSLILKRILLLLKKNTITVSEVDNLEGATISF